MMLPGISTKNKDALKEEKKRNSDDRQKQMVLVKLPWLFLKTAVIILYSVKTLLKKMLQAN